MKVAKGLACVAMRFLSDDAFAQGVKADFEKFRKEVGDGAEL
jgi:hypothetical protein